MPKKLSPFRQDLARYRKNGKLEWAEPSLWVIGVYRFGQWCKTRRFPIMRALLLRFHLPLYSFITLLTGIQLPRSSQIGGGLRIFHFGCIIINPDSVIGENCTIRHGVTIGTRSSDHDVPKLGENVEIGAGAMILGNIIIGNNVKIGSNAVVLIDVPDNHIAVGNPAKILPSKS